MGRTQKKKVEKSLRALRTVSFRKKSRPSETVIKSRRSQLQGVLGRIGGSRQPAKREAPTPAELVARAKAPLRNLALSLAANLDLRVLEGVPQAGPGLLIIALSTEPRRVVAGGVTKWEHDRMATYAPSLEAAKARRGSYWRAAFGRRVALPRTVVHALSAWKPKMTTVQSFTCAVCNHECGLWNLWLPLTCASCSVPLAIANNSQLLFSGDACQDVMSSLYAWLQDERRPQYWRPRRPRRKEECDFCGKSASGFNSCSECEALNRWAERVLLPDAEADLQHIERLQRDQDIFAFNAYEHMQICRMDLRCYVRDCVLFSPEALDAARVSAEAAEDAMDLLPDAAGASIEPSFAVQESVLDVLMRLQNGGSVEHPSFEEMRRDAYVARPRPTPPRPSTKQRSIPAPCSVPVPCSATPCQASAAPCAGGSSDVAAMLVAADAGGGDGREAQSDAAGGLASGGSVVARISRWLRGTNTRT